MQFSIGTNTAKLLFIHLVQTQYGCLRVNLPFHCKDCVNLLRGGGGRGAQTPEPQKSILGYIQ